MVLRRLHSAVGPGSSVVVPEGVRSTHLPTLSAHVTMVPLSPYYRVFRVSGLQDPCACSRSHFVERRYG